jgi:hypothetical protein
MRTMKHLLLALVTLALALTAGSAGRQAPSSI